MRVIVAGSRTIHDPALVAKAIEDSGFEVTTLICGCAPGVDSVGAAWAMARSINVERHPADWDLYREAAGPIRNFQMAKVAHALVLIWDGKSKGSASMKKCARDRGIPIHEVVV